MRDTQKTIFTSSIFDPVQNSRRHIYSFVLKFEDGGTAFTDAENVFSIISPWNL
jgi:hypothetical protein